MEQHILESILLHIATLEDENVKHLSAELAFRAGYADALKKVKKHIKTL